MRIFAAVCLLVLAFSASPVWAAKYSPAYPDTADSIKQPSSRMNFNASSRRMGGQQAYPQGPNNSNEPAMVSRPTTSKPKKTICVGTDCGCGSGRGK